MKAWRRSRPPQDRAGPADEADAGRARLDRDEGPRKGQGRRYETANGFAKDIQRYLEGDPVEACPPSASYKLRKYARKHRAALATVGAFALCSLPRRPSARARGLGESRAGAGHERREISEGAASPRQEREQMAIDAVRRYGDVVRETPELKNDPGLARLRAILLKEPQAFFKRLRDSSRPTETRRPSRWRGWPRLCSTWDR